MGKADKLQIGAKKTGRGLFADMQALKDKEAETSDKAKIASDIKKEEKVTQEVNVIEPPVAKQEKREDILSTILDEGTVKAKAEPVPEQEDKEIEPDHQALEQINSEVNNKEEKPRKSAEKAASRYEKDKFLLLDIRGYRDYVEHMSKAANMSATKYIRGLIEKDMEKNKDIYDAHKKLEQMLMNRSQG